MTEITPLQFHIAAALWDHHMEMPITKWLHYQKVDISFYEVCDRWQEGLIGPPKELGEALAVAERLAEMGIAEVSVRAPREEAAEPETE